MNYFPINPREFYLIRDQILYLNGYNNYDNFLNSKYWQSVKSKAFKRDHYRKCRICNKTNNIELHHETYKWLLHKFELRGLIPLCRKCHQSVHEIAYQKQCTFKDARVFLTTGELPLHGIELWNSIADEIEKTKQLLK